MMLQIRTSETTDVSALVDVWKRSVLATHHFLSQDDFRDIELIVAQQYLPFTQVWVAATADGRPVGFMGLSANHIDSLFIDPDERGKGIGKMLVAHAQQFADALGVLTVDVNEQNEQAVGFYRRMGFGDTGRSPVDGDGRPYPILHMSRPNAC